MYLESDFLIALVEPDDWLNDQAEATHAGEEPIYSSLLAYVQFLAEAYDPGQGIDDDVLTWPLPVGDSRDAVASDRRVTGRDTSFDKEFQ